MGRASLGRRGGDEAVVRCRKKKRKQRSLRCFGDVDSIGYFRVNNVPIVCWTDDKL